MALTDVRPYFRARMEAIGYDEHDSGFDFQNVPSNKKDRLFHIESGDITADVFHQAHDFIYPVTVRFYKRGFRKPLDANNEVDTLITTALNEIMSPSNRLGANIKDVKILGIARLPIDESNDNAIMIEMRFSAEVAICFS